MGGWLPWLIAIGVVVPVAGWAVTRWLRRGATGPATARRGATRPQGGATRPKDGGPARKRAAARATRPKSPTRPARGTRPRPGEIWWADVPYADGAGSKVRPCLVLRTRRGSADVLKITSQPKGDRADHVRLPTRQWDPRADRDSFLDALCPIQVTSTAFARLAGPCDPTVWRAIQRLHGVRPGR